MGSDNFEQDLGELSGQLKALMPTLERMEARLLQAQVAAAGDEARSAALRKEFDDLKIKVSARLSDLYKRIENVDRENTNLKNQNGSLKRDIKEAVANTASPLMTRIGDIETKLAAMEEKKKSIWIKVWEVVKILLAAGVGAVVSKIFK
jgi:chromosome segregation ATPase